MESLFEKLAELTKPSEQKYRIVPLAGTTMCEVQDQNGQRILVGNWFDCQMFIINNN